MELKNSDLRDVEAVEMLCFRRFMRISRMQWKTNAIIETLHEGSKTINVQYEEMLTPDMS